MTDIVGTVQWLGTSTAWFFAVVTFAVSVFILGYVVDRVLYRVIAYAGLVDAIYTVTKLKRDGLDIKAHFAERREVLAAMKRGDE